MRSLAQAFISWRQVLPALAAAVLIPASMAAVAVGPWSPLQTSRAAEQAGRGDLTEATWRYERHAAWAWTDAERADALFTGGTLAAVSGDSQRAVRMLRTATREFPDDPRASDALGRLSEVLADEMASPARAAVVRVRAADADPDNAVQHRLRAADFYVDAGMERMAFRIYEQVAKDEPSLAHAAWLQMGMMRLESGDADGAARLFERVMKTGAMGDDLALAQLGATIAHEDLGDFDAVLAELDWTELSDEVATRRRERVQAVGW